MDPGRDPIGFAVAVFERAPLLLTSLWGQIPIDAWMFLPRPLQVVATGAGVAVLVALAALLLPLLHDSARARFWALGMLGATVPVCASFPMDRLTIYGGIGAFALLAMLVERAGWLDRESPSPPGRLRRITLLALLVLHGVLVLVLLPLRTQTSRLLGNATVAVVDAAPSDPAIAEQTLIYVNGVDLLTMYLPFIRMVEGGVIPDRTLLLSSMFSGAEITRLDGHTLTIRPDHGFLYHGGDCLLRDRTAPFSPGQRIRRPGFEVEVLTITGDGRPAEARFVFDVPLESGELRWMIFSDGALVDFPLPAVGAIARIEPTHPFVDLGLQPGDR